MFAQQDFVRSEGAYLKAAKTLTLLEESFTVLAVQEGKVPWDRCQTTSFLEEKGPTGSGKTHPGNSVKTSRDRLKAYVLQCVCVYSWTTKIPRETMLKLLRLWSGLPTGIPTPHKLMVHRDTDPDLHVESINLLRNLYLPFAFDHLTQVGQVLLDGLAAIRHHEGCDAHVQAQGDILKRAGVRAPTDTRCSCTLHTLTTSLLCIVLVLSYNLPAD
jgi:hypothetical protein